MAGDNGCGFALFALDAAAEATRTSAASVLRKLTVNTVARQTQRDFTLGTVDIDYVNGPSPVVFPETDFLRASKTTQSPLFTSSANLAHHSEFV
jgi:hypothetical protein